VTGRKERRVRRMSTGWGLKQGEAAEMESKESGLGREKSREKGGRGRGGKGGGGKGGRGGRGEGIGRRQSCGTS